MSQRFGPMTMIRDRFQWVSYGFIAGVILGLILGWLFHSVVGWIFRFGLVALLLVPLVILFIVWRRFSDGSKRDVVSGETPSLRGGRDNLVETDSYVIETQAERRER
jgi:hypothetical protein